MASRHSGATLHGLRGIPPSSLQQEPPTSDLRGRLRNLRGECRGHGSDQVCGKSPILVCVMTSRVLVLALRDLTSAVC